MIGDTAVGHVDAHNELRTGILREAERFGAKVDLPTEPYVVGAPGHIQEHNKTRTALLLLSTTAGVPVTLPEVHKLGDTGHAPHDHDLFNAALDILSKADAWNDATGGAITDFTKDGLRYRRHTFTSSGAFTVTRAVRLFNVYLFGGGAGGGGASYFTGGTGGTGGFVQAQTLLTGSIPANVGGGGSGRDNTGDAGGDTTLDKYRAGGGGSGNQNPQTAGRYGSGRTGAPSPEGDGEGSNRPTDTSGAPQAALGLSGRSRGGAGGEANTSRPGENGTGGAIVIEYQIGVAT